MDVSKYGLFLVMRAAEKFAASEPGRIALPKDQQINVDPHRGRFQTIFCLPGIHAPASYSWNEHILLRDHLGWLRLHPNDDCELASFCELKKQQVGICASLFRVLADLLDTRDLPDPISNATLARKAGLKDPNDVSQQLKSALSKADLACKTVHAGEERWWTHSQLRAAYPHLRDGRLKNLLERSGLANRNETG